jgi:Protein of unknown function (DUF3239)
MVDESTLLHGDEIDGYRAAISTGLKPRFWHYHLHDGHWRSCYIFLFVVTPLGLLLIWLGMKALESHLIKAKVIGLAMCGVGGLMVLLGPLLALGMAWMASKWVRHFRHGLLIPGVVVAGDSLTIVGLADLGKDEATKGKEFGLARADIWNLPSYSHAAGTRVPCVANFSEEGRERFFYFSPYPVSQGTGDEFDLEMCMQRLGEAPFRRLEGLIARSLVPEDWRQMVMVDANDEVIETRAYGEAMEMTRAEREQAAASKVGADQAEG